MKKRIFTFVVICFLNHLFAIKDEEIQKLNPDIPPSTHIDIPNKLDNSPNPPKFISTSLPKLWEGGSKLDPIFNTSVSERKKKFEELKNKIIPKDEKKDNEKRKRSLTLRTISNITQNDDKTKTLRTQSTRQLPHQKHIRKKSNSFSGNLREAGSFKQQKNDENPFDTLKLKDEQKKTSILLNMYNQEIKDTKNYEKKLYEEKKRFEENVKTLSTLWKLKQEAKEKEKKNNS